MRLWNWSAELCRLWGKRAWQDETNRSICRRRISGGSGWSRRGSRTRRPIRSACRFSRKVSISVSIAPSPSSLARTASASRPCWKASLRWPATIKPAGQGIHAGRSFQRDRCFRRRPFGCAAGKLVAQSHQGLVLPRGEFFLGRALSRLGRERWSEFPLAFAR